MDNKQMTLADFDKTTQKQRLLAYLKQYGSITALEALRDLGIMNIKGRIWDLRKNHKIKTEWVDVINRWGGTSRVAKYRLEDER